MTLSFWAYLKLGVPVTLLTTGAGVLWISFAPRCKTFRLDPCNATTHNRSYLRLAHHFVLPQPLTNTLLIA